MCGWLLIRGGCILVDVLRGLLKEESRPLELNGRNNSGGCFLIADAETPGVPELLLKGI
eukprot:XP_001704861.1 Hypothetical protein GL50803_22303 [Giardia lamblia ATCC 50803]